MEKEPELDIKLVESLVVNAQEITQIERKITSAIAVFQQELETKQSRDIEIREAIKTAMRDNGVKKFENEIIALTYIASSSRTTIDTARLKEEKPELWNEYSKTTETKDSVRIKIKEIVK